ncbi:hypothetical protein MMC25_000287 [Agyrium rufum]|nr:hypothetical protein [Agyrium rufum]
MSGLELLAVVGCVAAVCSAYNDGNELVRKYREKKRIRKAREELALQDGSTENLEHSLVRGSSMVQSQYDHEYRRWGNPFAEGDQVAREELKDILILLQGQIILNLKIAWQQDTSVNFGELQETSDTGQDRAIMCLLQLQQRIMVRAPIKPSPATPLPQDANARIESRVQRMSIGASHPPVSSNRTSTSLSVDSEHKRSGIFSSMRSSFRRSKDSDEISPRVVDLSGSPGNGSTMSSSPLRKHVRDDSTSSEGYGLGITSTTGMDGGSSSAESSHLATPEQQDHPEFNPWRSNEPYDPNSPPLSPLEESVMTLKSAPNSQVAKPSTKSRGNPQTAIPNHNHRSSNQSVSPVAHAQTSLHPSNQQAIQTTRPRRSPTLPSLFKHTSRTSTNSTTSSSLSANISQTTNNTALPLLPHERNNFQGFCKSAWRMQVGDEVKTAMDLYTRPGPAILASQVKYWKCTKCAFEGQVVPKRTEGEGRKRKSNTVMGINERVYGVEGIRYRWMFLFKSHLCVKEAQLHGQRGVVEGIGEGPLAHALFGCLFCCAEGTGPGRYEGVAGFMEHLQEHRVEGRVPEGEVRYRVSCVVGACASKEDPFDVCLFPL